MKYSCHSTKSVLPGCEMVEQKMAEVSGGLQVRETAGTSETALVKVSFITRTSGGVFTDVQEHWSSKESDFLYMDDLNAGEEMDVDSIGMSNVFDELSRESVIVNSVTAFAKSHADISHNR